MKLGFYAILLCAISLNAENISKERKTYLKNKKKIEHFKDNMPEFVREYYLPRKRYIDKQPVSKGAGPYWQGYLLIKGAELRENYKKNRKEILKLEDFLLTADDFQLGRYFSGNEERYFQMKAEDSIREIKELAKQDETWRHKNDPIFSEYIQKKATPEERQYYRRYKSRFFSEQTGNELVDLLKKEANQISLNAENSD